MTERHVLVTGCSSGIGRALARGLKARGYAVWASARKPADVAALAAEGLNALPLDLASSESIGAAVETVLAATGGRLYGLINNGAYGLPGAVEDLSRAALRAQFETNVFGTHELTARLLPVFRAQDQGRIVQISSVLGLVCLAYRGAYNASKFALEALTDTLRLELGRTGIRIALIEPGPIATRFRDNAYAAYRHWIDPSGSAHRDNYAHMERRLQGSSGRVPFTLPAEAVLAPAIHALESPRPRARYAVTAPTRFFALARRLLPTPLLDRLLWATSGAGRR